MNGMTTLTIFVCWAVVVCIFAILQIVPKTTAATVLLCGMLAVSLVRQLCNAIRREP